MIKKSPPGIAVAGRGYWRFETERSQWLFYPPTSEHDEIIDFISGVSNTIPQQVWMRGQPLYGNYISTGRYGQEC